MKKLLSVITAAALAFGLISCSGDLHDKEITPLYIIGTCWGTRTSFELVDETTQKISFTYDNQTGWDALANEVHFKIVPTNDTDWNNDFGGGQKGDKGTNLTLELNKDYVSTISRKNDGLTDNGHIVLSGLDVGKEYTIFIKYTAAENKVEIKYEGPEAIPTVDISAVAGSSLKKFEMSEKNTAYSLEIIGDGNNFDFTLFDGKDSYGLAETKDISDGKSVTFKKSGKPARISTDDGKKYLISVNISEDGVITGTAVPALFNFKYGLKYLCSNYGNYDLTWVADGTNQKAVVTIPAGTKNGWGGANDADLSFGITSDESWTVKFTGGVLGLNNPVALKNSADDNNSACVNPSKEAITVTIIASETDVTAAATQTSVDASALCFVEPLAYFNSNYGNYALVWKTTDTVGEYKAVVTIPAGTKSGWSGKDDDDLEFGVCNDTEWGVKYTGGVLSSKDTAVKLTKNVKENNKASVNPSANDIVISIIATKDSVKASF